MDSQVEQITPDYLILGHISEDLIQEESRPGGTVLYSGILAQRMGLSVAVITSCDRLPDLAEITEMYILNLPAEGNTTFRNIYTSDGRRQYLLNKALDLDFSLIPKNWQNSRVIHFGPIAREIIPPSDISPTPKGLIAYSLQGWLRNWDEDGLVYPVKLDKDFKPLRKQSVGFLSHEDLGPFQTHINHLRDLFPLLVLNKGKDGAVIYQGEELIKIQPEEVNEIDPTGAGDIFAAGFMIYWVFRGKSVREAGSLASKLAALSVTRPGIEGIPTVAEIHKIEQN